ncbi:MAG: glycosyltransferase family 2 protein [Patescibacteria group bacterium]
MVDLSIIIVSYNTCELTLQAIDSIIHSLENSPEVSYEIIVVDNNSTDNSKKELKSYKLQVTSLSIIENQSNVGFGRANNIGLKQAKGDYVLFLNSDVIADKLNFNELFEEFKKDPKIGVLTVKVVFQNGKLDPACHRGFPTLWRSFCYFSKLERITSRIPVLNMLFGGYHLIFRDLSKKHEIDSPSGAFYLVKLNILKQVDGFDEAFFMYGEDIDLSLRIKKLGHKIIYFPSQLVTHLKYQSGIKNEEASLSSKTKQHFYEAMTIFYKKHYEKNYPTFINWIVYSVISRLTARHV